MSSRHAVLLALLAIAPAGCGSERRDLIVDVRTDLTPGIEFVAVETHLVQTVSGMESTREDSVPALRDDDFLGGARVAEFQGVAAGAATVRVVLRDNLGAPVLFRSVHVQISGDYGLTVVLTRSCRNVRCPGMGDEPSLTECLRGRCVEPTCHDANPDACGEPECTAATDCPEGPTSCVGRECIDGTCLLVVDDGLCETGARCDFHRGCVSDVSDAGPRVDAGPAGDAGDAAVPDGGSDSGPGCVPADCDDDNPCTDDSCGPDGCENVNNADPCDDGMFCNGADTCMGGSCAIHPGDPCPGASVCNESDRTCDGCADDGDCPGMMVGPWSSCSGFTDACDESGTRQHVISTFRCVAGGVCARDDRMEEGACTRATDGVDCGGECQVCTGGVCGSRTDGVLCPFTPMGRCWNGSCCAGETACWGGRTCQEGTTDAQCGRYGDICLNCTDMGQVCCVNVCVPVEFCF